MTAIYDLKDMELADLIMSPREAIFREAMERRATWLEGVLGAAMSDGWTPEMIRVGDEGLLTSVYAGGKKCGEFVIRLTCGGRDLFEFPYVAIH